MANRCFLCNFEVEIVDHILIHCAKLWVLWHLLFSLFGVSWVLSCSVKGNSSWVTLVFVGKTRKKAWLAAPLCIFWIVWKEMNLLAFDSGELLIQRLKIFFVCNLWSCSRVVLDMTPFVFF